jgi:DNA-binding NarL/FixJ family response regulator
MIPFISDPAASLQTLISRRREMLTSREEQVAALVAEGLSNRQTAHELNISEHTMEKCLLNVFDKLGISSRVELVFYFLCCESRPTRI